MMKNTRDLEWDNLARFEITVDSGSDALYANGFQQVKLRVEVQASLNGMEVVLSDSEMAGIQLVRSDTNEALVWISMDELPADGWAGNTHRLEQFDYYGASRAESSALRSDNAVEDKGTRLRPQVRELWVQTTALDPLRIGARVTRQTDSEPFNTYDSDFENNEVVLKPQRIPARNPSNYTLEKTKIEPDSDADLDYDTLDYYALGINFEGRPLYFRSFRWNGFEGMYGHLVGSPLRGACVGYSSPGSVGIAWPPMFSGRPPLLESTPPEGVVTFVLQRWSNYNGPAGQSVRTAQVEATDSLGNPHTLTMTLSASLRALSFS